MIRETPIPAHIEEALGQQAGRAGTSRREFLNSGLFVVSFSAASVLEPALALAGQAPSPGAGPFPIRISSSSMRGSPSARTIRRRSTSARPISARARARRSAKSLRAKPLDMPYASTTCVMGTTNLTVDQGGSGGSDALQTDGYPMRRVAAEARRVLLDMASARLGVPVAELTAHDGVVSVRNDASKNVTYGELIGGRRFNVTLTGANTDATTGVAKIKAVQDLKIVGTSPPRYDIPGKVDGSVKWAVGVKIPGCSTRETCGRRSPAPRSSAWTSPPSATSRASSRWSPRATMLPSSAEREEQAIKAARQLKATWQRPAAAPFPASEDLFKYMRSATPTFSAPPLTTGDVAAALAGAAKVVEAEYRFRSRDTPQSGRRTRRPIPPTIN